MSISQSALSIHGSLTIPYRLDSAAAFERFVSTWRAAAPGLLPTHAESNEPVRRVFDPEDLSSGLEFWMNRVWLGRRKHPKLSVDVLTGPFLHSNVQISNENGEPWVLDDLKRLVLGLASAVSPDYGMVHALTTPEAAEAREGSRPDLMTLNRVTGKAVVSAGFTRQLQRGLPTLFWVNLFGPSYVELFGRGRLQSAPAAEMREEPWGMYLQVTPEPPSDETWLNYRSRRDALIDFLGRDAFWPKATRIAAAMRDFEPEPLIGG